MQPMSVVARLGDGNNNNRRKITILTTAECAFPIFSSFTLFTKMINMTKQTPVDTPSMSKKDKYI